MKYEIFIIIMSQTYKVNRCSLVRLMMYRSAVQHRRVLAYLRALDALRHSKYLEPMVSSVEHI